MSALTAYFALAGVLPFSLMLAGSVRGAWRRLQAGRCAPASVALTLLVLATFAAIDTGFIALVVRSVALTLHPPG